MPKEAPETHHLVPRGDDALHVEVRGEEGDHAIRYCLAEFDEERAKVADDSRVVANLEAGRDLDLVGSASDDLCNRGLEE